jgi:CRP-like cAMP-binding protein
MRAGSRVVILGQRSYFGESAVLKENQVRTATVRTLCFSELRALSRDAFLQALEKTPNMKGQVSYYA